MYIVLKLENFRHHFHQIQDFNETDKIMYFAEIFHHIYAIAENYFVICHIFY